MMETGCKPAELVRMKWLHFQKEKSTLYIANRNGRREVKCSPILMDMLAHYQEETETMHDKEMGGMGVGERGKPDKADYNEDSGTYFSNDVQGYWEKRQSHRFALYCYAKGVSTRENIGTYSARNGLCSQMGTNRKTTAL
ncbi:hypothetical protein OL548_21790 [Lysinibacillus sp. MHQ-1]|nr:hypothetical protein OL548_21790 [Lysinibacillus sp. MHQ-1]